MRRIFGVDFSGAVDAGERLWVTEGRLDGGVLKIISTEPASELPGGGQDLASATQAVVELVRSTRAGVFGVDVPFGIPEGLFDVKDWSTLVSTFGERFPDADAFREACQQASETERRRRTDEEAGTPFSPYNLRMYKQTYHAIRDVLA